MSQSIEEFLVKIGVDVEQAKKINGVINTLNHLSSTANTSTKELSNSMQNVGNSSNEAMSKISKGAEKSTKKLNALKVGFLALFAGIALYGNRLAGAFNSAINNAKALFYQKNALFKISQSEIRQTQIYQAETKKTQLAINSIATRIALNLLPNLNKVISSFNKWLTSNKELITKGITFVIKFIGNVIQVILNTVRAISQVIDNTIGWKNALIALSVAWAIFNRALLFSPLGLIIGLIVGIALVIDDLMVYLDGGKSKFGEFWKPCIDWIEQAIDWWSKLDKNWKTVIYGVLGYIGLLVGTKGILSIGTTATKTMKMVANSLGYLGKAVRALSAVMMSNPILAIITAIAVAAYLIYDNWDFLVGFFSNLWTNIKNYFNDGVKAILMYFGMSEDGASETVDKIGKVFSLIFDIIKYPFVRAWEFVKSLFSIWTDDSTSTTEKIGKSFSAVFDFITDPFKKGMKWINETFAPYIDWVKDKISGIAGFFGFGGNSEDDAKKVDNLNKSSSVPVVAGNQVTTTTSNNANSVKYDVNVNQSIVTSDPIEAGRQSSSGVNDAINQTAANSRMAFSQ